MGKRVAKRRAETSVDPIAGPDAKTQLKQGKVSFGLGGSRRRGKLIIRWSLVRIQAGPKGKALDDWQPMSGGDSAQDPYPNN